MRRYGSLLIFLVLVALAAAGGIGFRPDAWYAALNKPSWNPPSWLFSPVWTTLYVLIAIAGWRVWCASGAGDIRRLALALWIGQWIGNALWSWLFFGLHQPVWAMIDIAAMLVLVLAFIAVTWRFERVAAWLFLPYALWLAFAASLNGAIVQLNR
ncbi:MAG TPA: TspO/MBR family protein [Dokdonella sp.]|uniref:TspO/MBR family protein n=1 Tax=Dokdonella sp. TaxID=2291710 RepID=UPI002D1CA37F|nr:TspO/MBR family protein [Dokdonella sp.]HUD43535.1 TspO/MBR family protein [Dokdonella sp.]